LVARFRCSQRLVSANWILITPLIPHRDGVVREAKNDFFVRATKKKAEKALERVSLCGDYRVWQAALKFDGVETSSSALLLTFAFQL
jgi:hypothetical protein